MKKLLYKEWKLAASPLSFFFTAAAFLTLVPGYPILLGAFFTTLGIFYSFQSSRENNDLHYSLLLPVAKADVVRGKFLFTVFIELCSFCLMVLLTVLRMTVWKNASLYTANALQCANFTFLGFVLLVFGLFNFVFVRGFFKTAYYYGKPFLRYCVVALLVVTLSETLHHLPGLQALNAFGFSPFFPQAVCFFGGLSAFLLLTWLAIRDSIRRFEKIDL